MCQYISHAFQASLSISVNYDTCKCMLYIISSYYKCMLCIISSYYKCMLCIISSYYKCMLYIISSYYKCMLCINNSYYSHRAALFHVLIINSYCFIQNAYILIKQHYSKLQFNYMFTSLAFFLNFIKCCNIHGLDNILKCCNLLLQKISSYLYVPGRERGRVTIITLSVISCLVILNDT